MNYREARQVQDGPNAGRWHYTNMRDGKVWADGACRDGCPGHATAEEAYEHERQRLVSALRFVPLGADALRYAPGKCVLCDAAARQVGRLPHPAKLEDFRVCDAHANRDAVAPLVQVGVSISSW